MRKSLSRVDALLDGLPLGVFELQVYNAILHDELVGRSLKLKAKLGGATKLKTQLPKAFSTAVPLDMAGQILFEHGDGLNFDLCESRTLLPSRTVATAHLRLGQLPRMDGDAVFATALHAVGTGKLLATIEMRIVTTQTTLAAFGGLSALASTNLPRKPNLNNPSVMEFKLETEDYNQYTAAVLSLVQHRQRTFERLLAALGTDAADDQSEAYLSSAGAAMVLLGASEQSQSHMLKSELPA
jgi:hypothetical protein